MKKIILLLNFFILSLSFLCTAKKNNDNVIIKDSIESTQEYSVSFSFQENSENKSEIVYTYSIFDKDGKLIKESKVNIGKNMKLYKYVYSGNNVHYIYNNTGLKSIMNIVTINTRDMKSVVVESETPYGGFRPNKIVVVGDYICSKKNDSDTPIVRVINWTNGKQKEIPINIEGVTSSSMKLTAFEKTKNENSVFVNIYGIKNKRYANFLIKFDDSCVQSGVVDVNEISELITNFTITYNSEGYLINGAYSIGKDDKSSGIFICKSSADGVSLTKKISYLDIENFFEFTPLKTKKKALDMIKNHRINTATNFVEYNNSCHNLIQLKDGYIFIGDAYYPTFEGGTLNYNISTGSYAGGVSGGGFARYQYTHVFVIKFDKLGNMLWSKTFATSIKGPEDEQTAPVVSEFKINDDNSIQLKYHLSHSIEKPKRSNSSQLSISVPIIMKTTKTIDENGILVE